MSFADKNLPGIKEILRVIPEDVLIKLSADTNVDYCAKLLTGKLMFYLLLFGLLKLDRLSQRTLCDAYGSSLFKTLFGIEGNRQLSHSSISDRLSSIDLDFFRLSYEHIYQLLSGLYSSKQIEGARLQRVDSTYVSELSNKLEKGLKCGQTKNSTKKMAKYTFMYDGNFLSHPSLFLDDGHVNENQAIPECIYDHVKKQEDHSNIYVFDRGVMNGQIFSELTQNQITFVGRLKDNRKLKLVESLLAEDTKCDWSDGSKLEEDSLVQLYTYVEQLTKNGTKKRKSVLVEQPFRVIRIITKKDKHPVVLLITNDLNSSAEKIARIYRKRWDIEVFFRFIKQELNFKHFLSMNANGIQVMMYMTAIAAMLIMIYKSLNNVGYTTAKRRIGLELEELIGAILVVKSGGDLKKVGLEDP